MNQISLWLGGVLSMIYGVLSMFAGFGQTWAAWLFALCGLIVIIAGATVLLRSGSSIWLLVTRLLGIHALALNNGFRMFGKVNPSHHLMRLVISITLITLTYLGLK